MKTIEVVLPTKTISISLVDKNLDNCPVCAQPLKDTWGSWNMMHGEMKISCCGAPYQVKDYYVDDTKQAAYADYFRELNKPGIMSLSVDTEYIEPLKQAMKELGVRNVNDDSVYRRAIEIKADREALSNKEGTKESPGHEVVEYYSFDGELLARRSYKTKLERGQFKEEAKS